MVSAPGGFPKFYPIVPDARWVERIAPLGIGCVQLRIKDAGPKDVRHAIRASLAACRASGCQLIVNDYWREAIDEGADYIHLGQEDLAMADLDLIRRTKVRFGLSTHDEAELDVALAARPDYIALGPVFPTTLKVMRFAPQGLDRVGQWKRRIGAIPLIAIGGITLERAAEVYAQGADSISVVSDVTSNPDPEARIRAWLATERQRM